MALIELLKSTLLKTFSFKGRATRKEYWIYFLFNSIVSLILLGITLGGFAIHPVVGYIFFVPTLIVLIGLAICGISVAVRRLHDVGLSGFWFWYLNPCGLPVIYTVYLLNLDEASNLIIEKIQRIGSAWLGWILTLLFWPIGASAALLLLFLYAGKKADNEFGPNPYAA